MTDTRNAIRTGKILFLLGIIVFMTCLLLTTSAREATGESTWYVDDDAPDGGDGSAETPYNSIQQAIENASEDDTIRVYEGTYYESIVVDKSLSLNGNGSSVTIIDGTDTPIVVDIKSDNVEFTGFSAINGEEGTIEMGAGIMIRSDHNTIRDNDFSSNQYGMVLLEVSDNILENNTCSSNLQIGIYLKNSTENHLQNNYCSINLHNGIALKGSDGNTLKDNTCDDNNNDFFFLIFRAGGILLYDSSGNILTGNIMMDEGLRIDGTSKEHWNTNDIQGDNTFNGSVIRFYRDVSDITITGGEGQIILANCSNMIIEDQNISYSTIGISVGFSTNITVRNNICTNNANYGIWLFGTKDSFVENNQCGSNYFSGIRIEESFNVTISGNECHENWKDGIYVFNSPQCNTIDNICNWNRYRGIQFHFSKNGWVEDNECRGNTGGIHIYRDCHNTGLLNNKAVANQNDGLHISHSDNCTVYFNQLEQNGEQGLYNSNSDNTRINNNIVTENERAGIWIISSIDTTITYNTCTHNKEGILLFSSSNQNLVENNECNYNDENGIIIKSLCDNNTVSQNMISFNQCGVFMESMSDNNIVNNNTISYNLMGCNNTGTEMLNATNNWWGDNSGPFHPTENPDGLGNPVTDHVDFDPWIKKDDGEKHPDLMVKSIDFTPDTPMEGNEITIMTNIMNQGELDSGGFSVMLWVDDPDLPGTSVLLGTDFISSLSGGDTQIVMFTWNDTLGKTDEFQLRVVVDTDNEIVEHDEQNNVNTTTIIFQERPGEFSVELSVDVAEIQLNDILSNEDQSAIVMLAVTNTGTAFDVYYLILPEIPGWEITANYSGIISLDPGEHQDVPVTVRWKNASGNSTSPDVENIKNMTIVILVRSGTREEVQDGITIQGIADPDGDGLQDDSNIPFLPPAATALAFGVGGLLVFFRRRRLP